VDAAGIVADHAADGAAVVAGGIGGEGQVIFFGGVAEVIQDYSGLDSGDPVVGIDLENLSHVLCEVENNRDVAALSGEGGAAAATQQRSAEFAADGDGGEDVIGVAREDYADWNLAVVRTIGRVEGAAAVVELHVAADVSSQGFVQPQGISE
jgi:hypothetical protein